MSRDIFLSPAVFTIGDIIAVKRDVRNDYTMSEIFRTPICFGDIVRDIPGIDVGGGWRTGCGCHPQSAERVEELEESVWSVVRQENEREDQGEGVQNCGMTSTDVRSRDMGVR